ncbi:MAG: hypothetical protein KC493_03580 [Bacteriovoracaceae bacterium]|nr:hypothetical protein [Bacteriovoracaceae bacterium]
MKITLILVLISLNSYASGIPGLSTPDWSETAVLPAGTDRADIYKVGPEKLKELRNKGYIHAMKYPIKVSGALIPYEPLRNFMEADQSNPLRRLIRKISGRMMPFQSMEEIYKWLGLYPFNDENATGIYKLPYPEGTKPDYYIGASIIDTPRGKALTFSCATCHSMRMFGKTVMGLTNKRPRANNFFTLAKKTIPLIPSHVFKAATKATEDERKMFRKTKYNLFSIGAVDPQVLGLDTSFPQVALSLARRKKDEYASKSKFYERFPRKNKLEKFVADSKPATWWNLKYKTRWLSDGSIVQGNPIFTNFLWNEIGRGVDLKELEDWLKNNMDKVQELTAAVFATEAPKWVDFFPASSIDIEKAKRGETIFNNTCKKCHGTYEKGWSLTQGPGLSLTEQLKTVRVTYHEKTPVKNVGTDPQRWQGTEAFAGALNKLKISKWMKTVVEPQEGYVPPPLVGIWARYPYFHNNSIPNLCALVTPSKLRPTTFYQGPADNPETDFTKDCVGYPVGNDIPKEWKEEKDAHFDTRKPGLSNKGHYRMWLDENQNEIYSHEEKMSVIEYLKTL